MAQSYLLVNVTQSQKVNPWKMGLWLSAKAIPIVYDRFHELMLALFLIDLGDDDPRSLESLCLKYISSHEQLYSSITGQLPKYLQDKLGKTYLSQHLVGAWSGNRLIITGDYSAFSPFPPNGEWKEGNLYEMKELCDSHVRELHSWYYDNRDYILTKLRDFCNGKTHVVVNLDKKEYLDPQVYGGSEKHVQDFVTSTKFGILTDLVIHLIHSTVSGGFDLSSSVTSQGLWAGDRITICTPEQLGEFSSYKNVSSTEDLANINN